MFCYLGNFLLKLMVTVSVFFFSPKFISRVFPFVSGALEKRVVTKGEPETTPQRGCERDERI